jgi:hypothetical protein
MDMVGFNDFLEAWTAVLREEEGKVKPFIGFGHDPLAGLDTTKTRPLQKYIFADTLLIGWMWLLFGLRYIFTVELFWHRREEERVVFLPARQVDSQH